MDWLPSRHKATSVEVPPISRVSTFGKPAFLAIWSAPATPPAGPDITAYTGRSWASGSDISPASERRMFTSARRPWAVSWSAKLRM